MKYWIEQENKSIFCKDVNLNQEANESYERMVSLFKDKSFIEKVRTSSIKEGLIYIHKSLFKNLHLNAGKIRKLNISKGNTIFCNSLYIEEELEKVNAKWANNKTLEQLFLVYVDLNVIHPFLEGNGRSTRFWLDIILKLCFGQMVNWINIDKESYLKAMIKSAYDPKPLVELLSKNLMKGIDNYEAIKHNFKQSYSYENLDVE